MDVPTLRGRHVILEPLTAEHAEELAGIITPEDDVWRWLAVAPRTPPEMEAWILARQTPLPGRDNLPFVQRDSTTGALMGSTSIFDLDRAAESAEVGYTWLAAPYRRTGANTEAKLLLFTHCFEALGLQRVQLVTDERNVRSRTAIARVGATFEGVLRNFRRAQDGKLRNSAFFSITAAEWAAVKSELSARVR